jgi:hypothetical protein
MIILIIASNFIEYLQEDFTKTFDSQTVELRDFALVIDSLPEKYSDVTSIINLQFVIFSEI